MNDAETSELLYDMMDEQILTGDKIKKFIGHVLIPGNGIMVNFFTNRLRYDRLNNWILDMLSEFSSELIINQLTKISKSIIINQNDLGRKQMYFIRTDDYYGYPNFDRFVCAWEMKSIISVNFTLDDML